MLECVNGGFIIVGKFVDTLADPVPSGDMISRKKKQVHRFPNVWSSDNRVDQSQ